MVLKCGAVEDSREPLGLQGDPTRSWVFIEVLMLKLKFQYFGYLIRRTDSLEKTLMLGKEEKGTTEDEMVGWHHRLEGHEFGQTSGAGDGQGSLVCCSRWGRKESDTTERLNWTEDFIISCFFFFLYFKVKSLISNIIIIKDQSKRVGIDWEFDIDLYTLLYLK